MRLGRLAHGAQGDPVTGAFQGRFIYVTDAGYHRGRLGPRRSAIACSRRRSALKVQEGIRTLMDREKAGGLGRGQPAAGRWHRPGSRR